MTKISGRSIYMLTDAGTFSSGHLFALLLKDNKIGILIGEPTGNQVNFNGNELQLPIPDTDFYLNISTTKILRPDQELGDASALAPDHEVYTTRSDIVSGRDPQMEYLLKLVK